MSFFGTYLRRPKRRRPTPEAPPTDGTLNGVVGRVVATLRGSTTLLGTLNAAIGVTSALRGIQAGQTVGTLNATIGVVGLLRGVAAAPAVVDVPISAGNRAYRHGRPNVVLARGYDTDAEIFPHIQGYGGSDNLITNHPELAIRDTTPANVMPGFTSSFRLGIYGAGGEPDMRAGIPVWQSGTTYAVEDSVRLQQISTDPLKNGLWRAHGCVQAHVAGAPGTLPPDTSDDGGDNAYWSSYSVLGFPSGDDGSNPATGYASNLADDSIQYIQRLSEAFEPTGPTDGSRDYLGFGPGTEWWISRTVKIDELLAESNWQFNTGSGGFKFGSCSHWDQHNIGNGQAYWNASHAYGSFLSNLGGSSGRPIENFGSQQAVPGGLSGRNPLQNRVYIRYEGEHPYNIINRTTATASRINIFSGTTDQIQRKRYGLIFDYADLNRGENADPLSGSVMMSRDMIGRWVTLIDHFKFVGDGTATSLMEQYYALPGMQAVLHDRAEQAILFTDDVPAQPNSPCPAYGTHANGGGTRTGVGYNAFWFTMANTARISKARGTTLFGTNRHSSLASQTTGNQPNCYVNIQELLVTTGPTGPIVPGRIDPITSCDIPENYAASQVLRRHGRTNYRNALQPGQYCVLDACMPNHYTNLAATIPPEWGSAPSPAFGAAGPDGPSGLYCWASAYSGLVTDMDNRMVTSAAVGGHSCTGYNGSSAYFCGGDYNHPGGWRLIDTPSNRGTLTGLETQTIDGTPAKWRSIHTYDGQCRTPDGRFFNSCGYAQPGSATESYFIPELMCWDPGRGTYTDYGAPGSPPTNAGCSMEYLPDYGVIFMVNIGSSINRWAMFDVSTNQFIRNWQSLPNAFSPSGAGREGNWSHLYRPGEGSRAGEFLILGSMNNRRTRWLKIIMGRDAQGVPTVSSNAYFDPLGQALNEASASTTSTLVRLEVVDPNDSTIILTPGGLLRTVVGYPFTWDTERDCGWWMHLGEAHDAPDPDRGRMGVVTPGVTTFPAGLPQVTPWTFTEKAITPVGTWNGSSLSGAAVPVPTFNSATRPLTFANRHWGHLMVDKGQDALIFFPGRYSDPPFYLAKPT